MIHSCKTELETHIKAKTPVILIVSNDPYFIYQEVGNVARSFAKKLYHWDRVKGVVEDDLPYYDYEPSSDTTQKVSDNTREPLSIDDAFVKERIKHDKPDTEQKSEDLPKSDNPIPVLYWFMERKQKNSILIMEDVQFVTSGFVDNWDMISRVKEVAKIEKRDRTLILVQSSAKIHPEIMHNVAVIFSPYPDREAIINNAFLSVLNEYDLPDDKYDFTESMIEATMGLTINEAKRAYSLAIAKTGRLTREELPIITGVKKQFINSGGILEFHETSKTIDDLGGLDKLKEWLILRKRLFEEEARVFGLRQPKGIILVGPPGTGKSLAANIVANILGWSLIRFDIARVFDQWVGLSEQNMMKAIACAESMAPCVLWIDEIDKGFSGTGVDDQKHETTTRVFGTFITWLQTKTSPVFIVATANNIKTLPPEFMRKGRFDEIFALDLPTKNERREILTIHLKEYKHEEFTNSDMESLSDMLRGYSGAEIDEILHEAALHAYNKDRLLQAGDVKDVIHSTKPLAIRRCKDILDCRRLAEEYAVPASSEECDTKDIASLFFSEQLERAYQ